MIYIVIALYNASTYTKVWIVKKPRTWSLLWNNAFSNFAIKPCRNWWQTFTRAFIHRKQQYLSKWSPMKRTDLLLDISYFAKWMQRLRICDRWIIPKKNYELICQICKMTLPNLDAFNKHTKQQHIRAKYIQNEFECEVCHKKYNRKSSLNKHLLNHGHGIPHLNSKISVKCEFCDALFPNDGCLVRHKSSAHKVGKCICCGDVFENTAKRMEHEESVHVETGQYGILIWGA